MEKLKMGRYNSYFSVKSFSRKNFVKVISQKFSTPFQGCRSTLCELIGVVVTQEIDEDIIGIGPLFVNPKYQV